MPRFSTLPDLGERTQVHLLELEFAAELLSGASPRDEFDRDRAREIGNLLKRVVTRQGLVGDHAICSVRTMGRTRIQWGFSGDESFKAMAALVDASPAPAEGWAERMVVVLDEKRRGALEAVAIPRDTRGAGRRARERARSDESHFSPRWDLRR